MVADSDSLSQNVTIPRKVSCLRVVQSKIAAHLEALSPVLPRTGSTDRWARLFARGTGGVMIAAQPSHIDDVPPT